MRPRVLITARSAISSAGVGVAPFLDAVFAGVGGIAPVTAFDVSGCRARQAASIRGFDPAAFIPPLKMRRIDQAGRLALAATRLLLEDAAFDLSSPGHDGIGVALGTFTAGLDSTVEYLQGLTANGPTGVPALLFSNTVSNAAASLCAIEHGLRGPNVTFNHRECSSGLALAFACGALRDERCEAMVAGGIDRLEETFFKMYDRFGALSPMRGDGEETARPFDRRRNGFVLGEGGFLVLLETEGSAVRRGARVFGELAGTGITAATTALNAWPDDPDPLARAMRAALDDAGCRPEDVDVIVATANGSPILDRLEAEAVQQVFGSQRLPVTSLKGAFGECGASGAASVIAALEALHRGVVPPTVGFAEGDSACAVEVSREPIALSGRTALVNTVGAAGTQCSLVVRAPGA